MSDLIHYGKKGMRWGVIKARYAANEKARNDKINKAIRSGGARQTSDAYRFRYLKDPAHIRLGKTGVNVVRNVVVREVITGLLTGKSRIPTTKAEAAKFALEIGKKTATQFVINDTLAKSALSRYTKGGKRIKGKWDGRKSGVTREDMAQVGIMTTMAVAPFAGRMLGLKLSEIGKRGRDNRERVEKWGVNILPAKVEDLNVAWTSPDGSVQVIDPSGKLN
jgi:hypothetical protein